MLQKYFLIDASVLLPIAVKDRSLSFIQIATYIGVL